MTVSTAIYVEYNPPKLRLQSWQIYGVAAGSVEIAGIPFLTREEFLFSAPWTS